MYTILNNLIDCLNPSFSGCPALGFKQHSKSYTLFVLIPLLVDVPLWGPANVRTWQETNSLNPSFSGCPALGYKLKLVELCSK